MALYYFEFLKRNGVERMDAISLPGLKALREEAVSGAKGIMREGISLGKDRSGWKARVYDEEGHVVLELRFADLLEPE